MAESLSSAEANKENDTQPELSSEVECSQTLSKRISNISVQLPTLSTVAMKGDDKLVERFMKETVNVKGDASQIKQSQLYIAAFWGFSDVAQSLLEEGAEANHQNPGSLWTPLHAAAFQEHGKVVMILLARNGKPDLEDSEGRTPTDFASASFKIWPHFAALGYQRTPKQELIEKGILQKAETTTHSDGPANRGWMGPRFARPGSAYELGESLAAGRARGRLDSTAMAACLSGDVLLSSTAEDLGISRRAK